MSGRLSGQGWATAESAPSIRLGKQSACAIIWLLVQPSRDNTCQRKAPTGVHWEAGAQDVNGSATSRSAVCVRARARVVLFMETSQCKQSNAPFLCDDMYTDEIFAQCLCLRRQLFHVYIVEQLDVFLRVDLVASVRPSPVHWISFKGNQCRDSEGCFLSWHQERKLLWLRLRSLFAARVQKMNCIVHFITTGCSFSVEVTTWTSVNQL